MKLTRHNFERFFAQQEPELVLYANRILKDNHAVEDVVQETFLRAFRTVSLGIRPKRPVPWLFRIARHVSIDLRRQLAEAGTELEESLLDAPPWMAQAMREIIEVEGQKVPKDRLVREIRRGVRDLPGRYRRFLHARYAENQSFWEIAMFHGISLENARIGVYRGREHLRELVLSRMSDPQVDVDSRRME